MKTILQRIEAIEEWIRASHARFAALKVDERLKGLEYSGVKERDRLVKLEGVRAASRLTELELTNIDLKDRLQKLEKKQ